MRNTSEYTKEHTVMHLAAWAHWVKLPQSTSATIQLSSQQCKSQIQLANYKCKHDYKLQVKKYESLIYQLKIIDSRSLIMNRKTLKHCKTSLKLPITVFGLYLWWWSCADDMLSTYTLSMYNKLASLEDAPFWNTVVKCRDKKAKRGMIRSSELFQTCMYVCLVRRANKL